MKVRLQFKDPDYCFEIEGVDDKDVTEEQRDEIAEWLRWNEYLCVEFDTKTGEGKIIKR